MEDEDHLFSDLKSRVTVDNNFIFDSYLDIDFVVCTNKSCALAGQFCKSFTGMTVDCVEDKHEKNKESVIGNAPFQSSKLSNQPLDTQ